MPKAQKRKAKPLPVVSPKGPPSNLRPAGAHKTERDKPRAEQERAALREHGADAPIERDEA